MTEDITSLQIKILYDSVETAEKRLKLLEQTGTNTAKAVEGFGGSVGNSLKSLYTFATGCAAVTAAVVALKAIVSKTAEFQKLKAMLETATGSTANAAEAFEALQDYATSTPSSLIEVTQAFIKLANYGLTPSERALKSYGNTASALGSTLQEMVEAVAKATSGEFEPLKKFAVKAKNNGDTITFSFRGVSETVKNTTSDIENYFMKLGEKNFAGAMEKQMNTLGGLFSNFGDEWDKLLNNIGSNGLGDVVSDGVKVAMGAIADLNSKLKSGELQANLDSWAVGWIDLGHTAKTSMIDMATEFENATSKMDRDGEGWLSKFKTSLKELPTNINMEVGAAAAWVAQAFEKMENAATYGLQVKLANGDFDKIKAAQAQLSEKNANAEAGAQSEYDKILADYEATIAKSKELSEDAKRAAADSYFDSLNDAEKKSKERLGQFRVAGDGTDQTTKIKKKKPEKDPEDSQWETLKRQLENQEGLVQESYEKRLALIEKYTDEGSEYQTTLEVALTKKIEEEGLARLEKQKELSGNMFGLYEQEENLIQESYDRRKAIILSATQLTEDEKNKMLEQSETEYASRMAKARTKLVSDATTSLTGLLENMQTISGAYGERAFAVTKGLAMAEAAVKGPQAVLNAYTSGNSMGGPIVGAVYAAIAAAATAAQIAKISSQEYSGAYAIGGLIPAGKTGLVGEAGPELVKGPAIVTSAQATWDRSGGASAGTGNHTEVNVINNTGAEVTQTRRQDGNKQLVELIVGKVREGIASDISKGGTRTSHAIESVYNLSRGRQ